MTSTCCSWVYVHYYNKGIIGKIIMFVKYFFVTKSHYTKIIHEHNNFIIFLLQSVIDVQ